MKLYAATDGHASNNYLAIIDENGERRFKQKLPNNADIILGALRTYKEEIVGIVVESTYNWYWLVDALMAEGYKVHLANPVAVQKYSGLKHADDKHDAFWLAEMLRLGIGWAVPTILFCRYFLVGAAHPTYCVATLTPPCVFLPFSFLLFPSRQRPSAFSLLLLIPLWQDIHPT